MARRTLSTQGRIVAAGVSIAVGGALVGFMAAGDHTADATSNTTAVAPAASPTDDGGGLATPYDGRSSSSDDGTASPQGNTGYQPQPQTRTGGS